MIIWSCAEETKHITLEHKMVDITSCWQNILLSTEWWKDHILTYTDLCILVTIWDTWKYFYMFTVSELAFVSIVSTTIIETGSNVIWPQNDGARVFQAMQPWCSFSIESLSHSLSSKSNLCFLLSHCSKQTNFRLTLVAMLKKLCVSFRSQRPTVQMLLNQTVGWPHPFFLLPFFTSWLLSFSLSGIHDIHSVQPTSSLSVYQHQPLSTSLCPGHMLSLTLLMCVRVGRRDSLTVCMSVSYV